MEPWNPRTEPLKVRTESQEKPSGKKELGEKTWTRKGSLLEELEEECRGEDELT